MQLACARIGAVHSVVFAGFSAESLADRIVGSQPRAVLTASAVNRGAKKIDLKVNYDTYDDVLKFALAAVSHQAVVAMSHAHWDVYKEREKERRAHDLCNCSSAYELSLTWYIVLYPSLMSCIFHRECIGTLQIAIQICLEVEHGSWNNRTCRCRSYIDTISGTPKLVSCCRALWMRQ